MPEIKITCKTADVVHIDDLVPFQGDLKTLTKVQAEKIESSILKYGFTFPGFVWLNDGVNYVVDSHQRLFVVKELMKKGWHLPDDKMPVVFIEAKDRKEAKAKVLLAASRYGRIDESGLADFFMDAELELAEMLPEIDLPDIDLGQFDLPEEPQDAEPQINRAKELNEKWKVATGDLWQIENHWLLCGDSTNAEDVEMVMGGEKADMVFTDPPYGVSCSDKNTFLNSISPGNRIQTEIEGDHGTVEDMRVIWDGFLATTAEVASDKASYYICFPQGAELMIMILMCIDRSKWTLKHTIIWVKNNHVLGRCDYHYRHEPILFGWKKKGTHEFLGQGKFKTTVWEVDKPLSNDLHPTMKPVELVIGALENSCPRGGICLDVFLGSGTTMVACQNLNRKCRGIEISPEYCSVILQRMQDAFGITGEKIEVAPTPKTTKGNNSGNESGPIIVTTETKDY